MDKIENNSRSTKIYFYSIKLLDAFSEIVQQHRLSFHLLALRVSVCHPVVRTLSAFHFKNKSERFFESKRDASQPLITKVDKKYSCCQPKLTTLLTKRLMYNKWNEKESNFFSTEEMIFIKIWHLIKIIDLDCNLKWWECEKT